MAETISKRINKMFEKLFETKDNTHPFFKDLNKVYKEAPKHRKNMKSAIKNKINHIIINELPNDVSITQKFDILDIHDLKQLDEEIDNILNYNKIYELVVYMSKYIIKSNINDKNKLYEKISENKKETINIMIIGSGPVGLFLACYLYLYYNKTSMNNSPRVNIIMYDSRIDKPGFRKPYNRQRLFATASRYLSLILPKMYCWDNKDYFMVNIFLLEYALFVVASQEYNIPMIYEDYDWNDYKKIIDKGKFDVVFDCTGGKLQHDVIKNINDSWINKIILEDNNINREITINTHSNLAFIENDKNHIYNYFYGSMEFYTSDLVFQIKYDIDINNGSDLMFLNKVKQKYYRYKDAITIISGIKDDVNRNFLYTMIQNNNDYLIKFDVWGIYMRHQIKISDVFNINNKQILLIGAGDTIFHSHFITGSGLNRIFDFPI